MNEFTEAVKGLTDLPITVIALILGFLAQRNQKRQGFSVLFWTISIAGFMGAGVHMFVSAERLNQWIWVILYLFLFEAVYRFSVLFGNYVGNEDKRLPILIFGRWGFYAGAVVLLLWLNRYDMLCLIAYSALGIATILWRIVKAKRLPLKGGIVLASLPVLLILQGFANSIPYAVVWEHILITFLLFVVYFIAKERKKPIL